MKCLLGIALLCVSPLLAVSPEFEDRIDHGLELETANVRANISKPDNVTQAEIIVEFTIINVGDELDDVDSLSFDLVLPARVIPKSQRAEFKFISKDRQLVTNAEDDEFRCPITLRDNTRLTVAWSWTIPLTSLPHEHPLGRRMFHVPLQYARGFVNLPDTLEVQVRYDGLPDELFGRDEPLADGFIDARRAIDGKLEHVEYRIFADTLDSRLKTAQARLEGFTEAQKTAENRAYTETLVLLSELNALAENFDVCAENCATLATLEAESGTTISHCGPWAKWRKYVPWALKRLEYNQLAGAEANAESAKSCMKDRWPAYLKARNERRPFDHFDVARFGNFWAYDWDRTRELYARTLEILGEEEDAANVRKTKDTQ